MSKPVKIWFGTHDIKAVELDLPALPRNGDILTFPPDFVKYYNGTFVEATSFKVKSVEFRIVNQMNTRIEINVLPLGK